MDKQTLKSFLLLDPDTGVFYWKKNRTFTAKNGGVAGGKTSTGYVRIKILGNEYLAHRLVWIYYYNSIPERMEIDHRNGNRSDNRLCNLRLANPLQQRANAKINVDNTSGYRGVSFNKRRNKWRVYIQREHLGYFRKNKEDAVKVYNIAFDKRFGEEFRRPND